LTGGSDSPPWRGENIKIRVKLGADICGADGHYRRLVDAEVGKLDRPGCLWWEYISEIIDDPETIYDPEIWDTPGFALVLSWLAQKWHRRCYKLAPRGSKNPAQYLTKEQQKACLDSAAAELIREITHRRSLS